MEDYELLPEEDDGCDELVIRKEDLVPVSPILRLNLDDLDEIGTFKHKDPAYDDLRIVLCEPRDMRYQTCPGCGKRKRFPIHGYAEKDRIVHDVNAGLLQIDLAIRVPRYRCDNCTNGKTFNHQFYSIEPKHRVTKRLREQIE